MATSRMEAQPDCRVRKHLFKHLSSLSEREARLDRSVPTGEIPAISSGGKVVDGQDRHIVGGMPQLQRGRQLTCRP